MFLIIDGSALVNTFFFATCDKAIMCEKDRDKKEELCKKLLRQNKSGAFTNATEATISYILRLLKTYSPEYVAVCFDKGRKTFRTELYPEYKAQREQKLTALKEQIASVQLILSRIGVPVFVCEEYEADDIAGSIVKKFDSSIKDIILLTKDHDWLQLVTDNTKVWMMVASDNQATDLRNEYSDLAQENDVFSGNFQLPNKVVMFNKDVVIAHEGVTPEQIPDLKGLIGDKSDNIPGAPGIGSATAIPLLHAFPNIKRMYDEIDICLAPPYDQIFMNKWNQIGVKKNILSKLIAAKDITFLSRTLATIYCDVHVPEDLRAYQWKINSKVLKSAIDWYEMEELEYFLD